jgi:hypothetical protein
MDNIFKSSKHHSLHNLLQKFRMKGEFGRREIVLGGEDEKVSSPRRVCGTREGRQKR